MPLTHKERGFVREAVTTAAEIRRGLEAADRRRTTRPPAPATTAPSKAPPPTTPITVTFRRTDLPALRRALERLEAGAETVELRARVVRRPETTSPVPQVPTPKPGRQQIPSALTSPQVRR